MAKGTVKGGGGGNGNPTLIVIDPGTGGTSDGGLGTGGIGATAGKAQEGSEMPYTSTIALVPGDIVDFTDDGNGTAIVNSKLGSGQFITGVRDQQVLVNSTSAALIVNATVSGKVTCNQGILVIVGNTIIDGKVDIDNNSTVVIFGNQVKVSGKVDSLNQNSLKILNGVVIDGKTTSSNDKVVSILGCTIEGKLEVSGAQSCNIKGNIINGKVVAGTPCIVS